MNTKIITLILIAFVSVSVAGGFIYLTRPKGEQVVPAPVTNVRSGLINVGGGQNGGGAVIIIANTNKQPIKLSNNTTSQNIFDKYVKKFIGPSMAYSVNPGSGQGGSQTTFYLPEKDYTVMSRAINAVLSQYSDASQYMTIVGNPQTGVDNLQYVPQYRPNPIMFANSGGNDLNFFEAYAFANFQTPFTMILLENNYTAHVAYVLAGRVYDIFHTYNYQDYITRVMYKYAPTTAYIVVFDTDTISIKTIPLLTDAKPCDIEATGTISGSTVTIVQRQNYFIVNWGTLSITRNGTGFVYNGAYMNYYPENKTMIAPFDAVLANTSATNYVYITGQTYTIIPTMNIMNKGVTIIAYQVYAPGNSLAGNMIVTYYAG